MIGVDVQTLLGIVFGVGGAGALTVAVTSYRRLKTGKLSDEESIIKRLHRELERAEARAEEATQDKESEVVLKNHWREQAWRYRLQLLEANVVPKDMDMPEGTS